MDLLMLDTSIDPSKVLTYAGLYEISSKLRIPAIHDVRPDMTHFNSNATLRKIDGTEMVPLGHRLMVRKTVPFRALFWCPFAKGH